jgi:hypothetical protein
LIIARKHGIDLGSDVATELVPAAATCRAPVKRRERDKRARERVCV